MNKEEIYNYCKKLTKKENAQFIYNLSYIEKASLEKFELTNIETHENHILNVTVLEKSQIGNYKITNITKKNIDQAIAKAKKIAKLKNKLPIKEFGSGKCSKKIKQDKKLENIRFSDVLDEVSKEITKDKYFKSYEGGVIKSHTTGFYMNPFTETENLTNSLSLDLLVNTKFKKSSSAEYSDIFTKVDDINIQRTFNQLKINANNLLNPKKGKKGTYTLIFTPEVTEQFLEKFVINATKGDVIEEKKSYLHEFKNKQIFSKKLSVMENPFLDYFLDSKTIDNQGFKTSKKTIIEEGVFKKSIYDQYTAIKYNKKPTGNGTANGDIEFTNILIKPGTKKIDTIIKNIKNGILVYGIMGLHTNKITNGEFALVIRCGKRIINGEFKETITNLNFTGNIKDILKNIDFSKEQKFFGDSLISFMILPNIKLI